MEIRSKIRTTCQDCGDIIEQGESLYWNPNKRSRIYRLCRLCYAVREEKKRAFFERKKIGDEHMRAIREERKYANAGGEPMNHCPGCCRDIPHGTLCKACLMAIIEAIEELD